MPKKTEKVDVYNKQPNVDQYGNVLPGPYTELASAMPINIHRGSFQSKDDAAALGISIDKMAIGYCDASFQNVLRSGQVLITPTEFWLIKASPSVRTRFRTTSHIRLTLQLLNSKPASLPALTGSQAFYVELSQVTGVGAASGTDTYTP